MTRTGRRPGTSDTRDQILAVARRRFATRGYDATSLRGIATDAKVDPALLIHYFGTKEGLFTAATGLPTGLSELFGGQQGQTLRDFAESLVRSYLGFVDSDQSRNAILALVRSAVSNERAAAMLREFLAAELLPVIASRTGQENAPLRAGLVEAVPGRAPDHVPGRPRPAGGPGAERGGKRRALLAPGRARRHPDPGLGAAEGPLGPSDVVGDRVTIAATAARPLAQHFGRRRHNRVQVTPARLEHPGEAVGLARLQRLVVPRPRHVRRAEVRDRGAGDVPDHLDLSRLEPRPSDRRVPLGIVEQRVDGGLLALAASAPARPVKRCGEHPPLAQFQAHPHDRLRSHRQILPSRADGGAPGRGRAAGPR